MLNFVLCDNNLNYLSNLEKALDKLIIKNNFSANIGFKSDDISEIEKYIKERSADVLFLDASGIDIARKLRAINKNAYIIFITNHKEYTSLAFEVKAFDYLPKKLSIDRLEKTLKRLFDDIKDYKNSFIQLNNKTYINQDDICYIKKDGMKAIVKTYNDTFETYISFNKLFEKLPDNFIRCHKSYIANVNNISHIELGENSLFFDSSEKCYIGPKYKDSFLEVIKSCKE